MLWSFYTAGTRDKDIGLVEHEKDGRHHYWPSTAAAFLLFLVIGFAAAVQLSRGITRQVQHMMDIFDKISIGDYSARAAGHLQ